MHKIRESSFSQLKVSFSSFSSYFFSIIFLLSVFTTSTFHLEKFISFRAPAVTLFVHFSIQKFHITFAIFVYLYFLVIVFYGLAMELYMSHSVSSIFLFWTNFSFIKLQQPVWVCVWGLCFELCATQWKCWKMYCYVAFVVQL